VTHDSHGAGANRGATSAANIPALSIHGAALHAMAEGKPEEAAHLSGILAGVLRERRRLTTRMLQALDAYWLHCDGLPEGVLRLSRHRRVYRRVVSRLADLGCAVNAALRSERESLFADGFRWGL
jgi:hypothetical protein